MKRWMIAALAAAPLVGLIELGAHVYFSKRAPSFEAWDSVAPVVKQMKQQGDVVVIAPRWAEPAARRALGDDLMPMRDVARSDVDRYQGAIEVSILGERAGEIGGFREVASRQEGKFKVRRLENPSPVKVLYDFLDHVDPASADVRTVHGGGPGKGDPDQICAWNPRAVVMAGGLFGHPTFPSSRFECQGGPFMNVGVTVVSAGPEFIARRCIWSHPPGRGAVVTRFRSVPLGQAIQGKSGMYWIIERDRRGAPVTLSVSVDGEVVGAAVHNDGDGWKGFVLPLGAHANKPSATVEFAVSSPNNVHRHYCYEAHTR